MTSLAVKPRATESNFSLRCNKLVPGIIYGANKDPQKITIDALVLQKMYQNPRYFTEVIQIGVDGAEADDVLAKDVQLDPVSGAIVHADFMRIRRDQQIRTYVPVRYINEDKSPALKRGGVLNIVVHKLQVRCSPYEIPKEFVCDLNGILMHDVLNLARLAFPENVSAVHPKRDNILATIVAPTGYQQEEAAE